MCACVEVNVCSVESSSVFNTFMAFAVARALLCACENLPPALGLGDIFATTSVLSPPTLVQLNTVTIVQLSVLMFGNFAATHLVIAEVKVSKLSLGSVFKK